MGPTVILIAALLAAPAGWAASRIGCRLEPRSCAAPPEALASGAMVLVAWAALITPTVWVLAASALLAIALLMLLLTDVLAYRLPDAITLPLIGVGVALSWFLPTRDVAGHIAGAVAGYGMLALTAVGYRKLRGREGIGLGDAKLLAAAGAWLGWAALPWVLILSCLGGFAWVLAAVLRGGGAAAGTRVPFGAPLCAAFWIVWLYGVPG